MLRVPQLHGVVLGQMSRDKQRLSLINVIYIPGTSWTPSERENWETLIPRPPPIWHLWGNLDPDPTSPQIRSSVHSLIYMPSMVLASLNWKPWGA